MADQYKDWDEAWPSHTCAGSTASKVALEAYRDTKMASTPGNPVTVKGCCMQGGSALPVLSIHASSSVQQCLHYTLVACSMRDGREA